MDQFGSQMRSFANTNGDPAGQRPGSQPQSSSKAPTKPAAEAAAKQHPNGCGDVKPRLTKDQHDILEAHFQTQHKPTTNTKKGFAESLGVPIDKINNWFQNRRAKVKQDQKKMMNQMAMNMNVFPSQHIPIVASHFPTHPDQQQPMPGEFYPMGADISPTCMPIESVERPTTLDLGSQISLHQPFDMHTLRSIPEANRPTSFNAGDVMQSFIAATNGASYMQHNPASLPPQQQAYAYDQSGLPNTFPNEMGFSMPATLPNEAEPVNELSNGYSDFSGFDYAQPVTTTNGAAEPQNSTGSVSSEPSPFSGAQSNSTTHSNDPNASSVASITSMYSGWTAEQAAGTEIAPANNCEDQFDYNLPQASTSEYWGPSGQAQGFPQADMYQHGNASAQAVLSSPSQTEDRKLSTGHSDFDPPPPFADDAYSRRNSSTTNLANTIESIHIQNGHTPDHFKQPEAPSSIAARRHKRPIALNSGTLRSASYSNGMPSPSGNGEHTLRRIRSSGIAAPGRIQKPNPGSAQRSPMTLTFAEAAASPKFQRAFTTSVIPGVGGSLAPPTPLTPNGFQPAYWQGTAVVGNHRPVPEHNSPESLNVPWSVEPQSAGIYQQNATSPPSTPLDVNQINQARFNNENLYRDTPPQSAPATQQSFPRNSLMQPPQMRSGFHSTTDLTIAQPKPSHWRRPSLPDGGHSHVDNNQMHYPDAFNDYQLSYDQQFRDINLDGIHHNVPFAPPVTMPEFLVHEYNPQGGTPGSLLRRITEPQQKSYIFANQGPGDFRS
ncbi:hypothetical protein BCR34DRAFT_256196 [Clohesyomyces aquaticus]|uniref:Homeobox domain-containing protein n=1 Tax=Clohesyomyces aquaticus TaxID=1231657 RepID=A0A1Y1ZUK3_9PLEO|nr:hypothetical protein BCR34DRAFT_256196 [Clohesyomyces aquaticus]